MPSAETPSDTLGGDVFRLAMVSSPGGMAILDREGRWLQANPAMERLLGRDAAQLAGRAITATAAARSVPALGEALRVLGAGQAPSLCTALALVHADGNEIGVRLEAAPMRDAAGRVRFLVVHVSETDAGATAQRLAEAEAALASMHRLQASFAHGVSHDLRAPLRAIDSFSALLATHLDGDLDDTARDYIARIRGASGRMATLIDSMLELSRAMRAELRHAPVDLGLLVDWSHAELADAEPGRQAQVEVQPGLQALGDERQLRELVKQLLHNAWKFSHGRDRVQVAVTGEREGGRMVLHVRDHGSGFDMRYADKLFEPFQRLHGTGQAGGNGIGLAIVRCIAERHGGRVWAQSEPGAGSSFFVELPAVPENGKQA